MSDLKIERRVNATVNLVYSVFWGGFAWYITWLTGAPHWASWAVAFLSFDAQVNLMSLTDRLKGRAK